jgi:hypothetical protein
MKNGLIGKHFPTSPKTRIRDFRMAWCSVVIGAVVRLGVGRVVRVVRTTEAVVVDAAAGEMSPSRPEVIPTHARNVTHAGSTDVRSAESADVGRAETTDVVSTEATDVGSTEATHVTSTKAAHVAATKAAHVAATKAATMSATATATGLRTRGSKAAGKQRGCQNHHPSSFHDLSPLEWAGVPPQDLTLARLNKANVDVAIGSKMGILVRSPY